MQQIIKIMKSKTFYILILVLSLLSLGTYLFNKKNHLNFELVSKVQNSNEEFYPLAYEFFHSQNAYDSFFKRNSETKDLKKYFPKSADLDFNNYSYCIFFGKSLNDLYFSYKATYFDDPSPSYASCRSQGKKFVVATYKDTIQNDEKGIFLYKVNKDDKLRGVYGL